MPYSLKLGSVIASVVFMWASGSVFGHWVTHLPPHGFHVKPVVLYKIERGQKDWLTEIADAHYRGVPVHGRRHH